MGFRLRAAALVRLAGYDDAIVARLDPRDARFFLVAAFASLVSVALAAAGSATGAWLADAGVLAVVVGGLASGALVWSLLRFLHAGTGFPLHLPIEDVDAWRPGLTSVVVLAGLASLMLQPLVVLVAAPGAAGLIGAARAAWADPARAAPVALLLVAIAAAPAALRRWRPAPVRAYERERWIDDRTAVDDAFADAQDAIAALLADVPGFGGKLALHFADPPYNTRPLVFGLDPYAVQRGEARLPQEAAPPVDVVPALAGPDTVVVPKADAPPVFVVPAMERPTAAATPAEPAADAAAGAQMDFDDASHDADEAAPPLAWLDVGRLAMPRARAHAALVAPWIAAYTGRPVDEVTKLIELAPDDARVHRLFPEYKKLAVILTKTAGFALEHGLARVVSIAVGKPVDDVVRRLRAAPPDKRLTGVFAPELARRLLKKRA